MSRTPTDPGVHWQPKQAALRDLVLRMLCGMGGVANSQTGDGVAQQIRKIYSIASTKPNNELISKVLLMMEQAGLITRQMNDAKTRTNSVTLVAKISEGDAIRLEFHRRSNVAAIVNGRSGDDMPEKVFDDVLRSHAALQRAATTATDDERKPDGLFAINVARILRESVGIVDDRAKRVRYYLRKLELARSRRMDENTWFWLISPNDVNQLRLMALIVGDDSFENWVEAEARKVTAREAAAAAPVSTTTRTTEAPASAAVARPIPGPPPGRKAALIVKATVVEVDEDPTETMAGIIERLEQRLEDQCTEHAAELVRKDEAHAAALAEKDGEIAQLQEQLRTRPALNPRAAAAIARHTQDG